jgi:hypothetical protein
MSNTANTRLSRPWIPNAVAHAMFHAKGGVRAIVLQSGATSLILVLAIFGTVRLAEDRWAEALASWSLTLLFIQSAVLLLGGVVGVSTAVRNDVASGMHDSLRLSRASPGSVILGYILGGMLQPLYIALPLFVAGMTSALLGTSTAALYFTATVASLAVTLFAILLSVLMSLVSKQPALPTLACVLGLPLLAGASATIPPVTALFGPIVSAIFDRRDVLSAGLVAAVLMQGVLGLILFLAAARKFLEPYRQAFRIDLSLSLLALCSFAGILACSMPRTFFPSGMISDAKTEPWMIAATVVACMIFMLAPLLSAAYGAALAHLRRSFGARFQGLPGAERPRNPYAHHVVAAIAVVLALLPLGLLFLLPKRPPPDTLWLSAALVAGFAWLAVAVTRRLLVATKWGMAISIVLILILMVLPILCELILQSAGSVIDRAEPTLAMLSPVFAVGVILSDPHRAIPPASYVAAIGLLIAAILANVLLRLPSSTAPTQPTA